MERKRDNKVIALNLLSTLILQGLTFFSAPIFSEILGPNNYGIASVYNTWVIILSTVFTLQAGGAVAIARSRFPLDRQKDYQSSALTLAGVAYLSFSVLTVLVLFPLAKKLNLSMLMVVFALLQGFGYYCVNFLNGIYTYEFKPGKNLLFSSLTAAGCVALSLVFVYLMPPENNHWGRIAGQSIVYTIMGAIVCIIVFRNGNTYVDKKLWAFTLPVTIPTIFHSLAHLALNQSDRLMLQQMISNSSVGIYTLAATFAGVIHSLWSGFNNSWVAVYYENTRLEKIDQIRRQEKNYLELFTILTCGFVLLTPEVFHWFAGEEYWSGTDLIPLFALGYYFVFLYSFPVNYEFYHMKTKTIAVATIVTAVFNIALNYVLIRLIGIAGAVIATAAAHFAQFLFHYIAAKRIGRSDFPFKFMDFVPGLVAVVAISVLAWFLGDHWLPRWGLGACLGIYLLLKMWKRKSIF